MPAKLSQKERLKLIERVIVKGEPVDKVCREAGISRTLFYRWLKRYAAEGEITPKPPGRPSKPPKRKKKVVPFEKLNAQKRLEAIERVFKYGEKVSKVCQDFGISRPAFYKWLKRYQEAPEDRKLEALQDKKPKVKRYYLQTPEKYEEVVLSVVAQYPELGIAKIVAFLPKIAGKSIVGYHGVQKILERHNLNTYEKRLTYAQAQITPVTRLISLLEEIGTRFIYLPVETRARIIRFASVAFLAAFSTTVILGLLGYFAIITIEVPIPSRIGLFFATIALSVGSIFFAYSMKYYLTLALVLSFSRQPLDERGGYVVGLNGRLNGNQGNGNGGWLARIFGLRPYGPIGPEGLGNGNGNGERREMAQAGGLQPSLDHIKLERYPFVSIHLPFYNENKVVERILKACTSMDYPSFEIVVVDDSTDDTTKIVQRYAKQHNQAYPNGPKIKVLHRPNRQGFKGGALAYALKHTDPKAEFVVVFDADFIPYPDTLELFVKYFKANNPSTGSGQGHSENFTKSNIAVVGGYQWHVLNKSENWVTRGIRSEYAGSYVIERSGSEILGLLKQISGSVYMIRADLLKKIGWGTSITEDFQLTLKLYEQGYKVIYTPYVQAPAECVSTLQRLIRQRMRWAEGHSNNIRRMFIRLMFGRVEERESKRAGRKEKTWVPSPLTLAEKLEVLYLSPYYLQAFFFLVGTFSWLMAETIFRARLPFWTSLWGWSLVLTNFFSLPLMNAVGLFLEESEERDYLGLLSFVVLSYILVPFQAYASVKGFLEKEEGPWFRTPKTGLITDIFTRGRFYRWISGILPGRVPRPALSRSGIEARSSLENDPGSFSSYLALATANSQFNNFSIRPKRLRWVSKVALTVLLCLSVSLYTFSHNVSVVQATPVNKTLYIDPTDSTLITASTAHQLRESAAACDSTSTSAKPGKKVQWTQFQAHTSPNTSSATPCPSSATGRGWVYQTPFDTNGKLDGNFTIYYRDSDSEIGNAGTIRACLYRVEISTGSIASSYLWPTGGTLTGATDMWTGDITNPTESFTDPCGDGCTFTSAQKYLYVDFYIDNDGYGNNATADMYFHQGACGTNYPAIVVASFVIPEKILLIAIMVPFIPVMTLWLKRRKEGLVFINH